MKKEGKARYFYLIIFAVGILVFLGGTLKRFYNSIQNRVYNLQLESMQSLSMQGSAVVEKKLEGLVNTLYGLSGFLEEDELTSEKNIKNLQNFLDKRDVGFQRLGIADAQGNAYVTNARSLNISDRSFFQQCMEEKRASIEIRDSELVKKKVCIIGVPVMAENEKPIGVFYGVIEMTVFRIYDNTIMENETQYIQIIDKYGNYVVKEETSMFGKNKNIFDGLSHVKSTVSVEKIRQELHREHQVFTKISNGTSKEIVYFTPLKLNNWCVVTVMNADEVIESMEYILGYDVYFMILHVIGAVFLLCLLILYYSWQDNKRIKEFNEQLRFDEKVFQIASEKAGFVVMSYLVNTKQLRFINNKFYDIHFPERIDNAPTEILKYIPANEKLREQVAKSF